MTCKSIWINLINNVKACDIYTTSGSLVIMHELNRMEEAADYASSPIAARWRRAAIAATSLN